MRRIVAICLCMAILLSGCGKQPKQEQLPVTSPSISEQEKEVENIQKGNEVVEQLQKLSETGEIVAVEQNENSLLCVQSGKDTTKLVVVDVKTGEQVEKKLPFLLLGSIEMQQNDEYTVLYDADQKVVVLNQDWEVVDSLIIKDKLLDGYGRNYCVLPRSEKIVYFQEVLKNGEWYQEVNECDYKGKKKKQICRIEDVTKSVGKVNMLTNLMISENEKMLYFCGLYYKTANPDESGNPCFGSIDCTSGNVTALQEEKTYGQLMKNKMMFMDGLREKGIPSSGYITCLDENGHVEKYTVQKKEESQEVIVSDKETYYLSYEKDDEACSTKITCYSFAKNEWQWEKKLSYYVANLWYLEDAKMLLYSYYDENRNLCFEKEDISK